MVTSDDDGAAVHRASQKDSYSQHRHTDTASHQQPAAAASAVYSWDVVVAGNVLVDVGE